MDMMEIIRARHSVRKYDKSPIEDEKKKILVDEINKLNRESGLKFQIFFDSPGCFRSIKALTCGFKGVRNYIAIVGRKRENLDFLAGYYGERIVLKAQEMGLNTCWVGVGHGRTKAQINKGEALVAVIAIGKGLNAGEPHQQKRDESVLCNCPDNMPDWFKKGLEAAMLAPSALNLQRFFFMLLEEGEVAVCFKSGAYAILGMGIAKYHFEVVTQTRVKVIDHFIFEPPADLQKQIDTNMGPKDKFDMK